MMGVLTMFAVAMALPYGEKATTAPFLDGRGTAAKRVATADVTWRKDSLQICVRRRLEPGEVPVASGTPEAPASMFGSGGESMELFLAPHPRTPGVYYQLAVNPSNVCYLAKCGDDTWRPLKAITTIPYVSDAEWGVDFVVPFGAFGEEPVADGSRWRANFVSGSANWSAIDFYHNPFAFGELAFGGTFPRVDPEPRSAQLKDGTLFELDRFYFPVGTRRQEIVSRFAGCECRLSRMDGSPVGDVLPPGEYVVCVSDGKRTGESQFEVVDAVRPSSSGAYYPVSGSVDVGSRLKVSGVLRSFGYDAKLKSYVYDSSLPLCGAESNLARRAPGPVEFCRFAYEAQIPVVLRAGREGPAAPERSSAGFYRRMYQAIKPKFQDRVFTLQLDNLKGLDQYADACDVLEAAFPGCSYTADVLSGMREAFDYIQYYLPGKPVVFWLGGALPNKGANRTADELNTAIRYSILRGAVGNFFHLGHGGVPETRTRLWDFMRGVERNVNGWYAEWVAGEKVDVRALAGSRVAVEVRKVKGGYMLLAANLAASPEQVSFDDPVSHSRRTIRLPGYGSARMELEMPVQYNIPRETDEARAARLADWQADRFGMFIHFGLYSMAGRHEWVKSLEAIPDDVYDGKYFKRFNPDKLDAKKWAKAAKAAGMKYAVLTTKHHEGFCLFDSKFTDYKSTNTPFGRDIVREFVDAFRAEGLKIGFYYSLIDWHHPKYVVDLVNHPQKGLSWELYKKLCAEPDPQAALKPYLDRIAELNKTRDMSAYRQYLKDQIAELLTNYGKIDILFYDMSFPQYVTGKGRADWGSEELLTLTRKLQPGIVVNCRLDLLEDPCGYDFLTPEQKNLTANPVMDGKKVAWETCQTFSGSWGYYRDELTWKSAGQIVSQLPKTVSLGGNLIMNVGPTGRGEFDARAMERLGDYARWMDANGRSIYGCGEAPAEFEAPKGTVLTWNAKTRKLYVHLLEWPIGSLPVKFWERIAYAQFLHDGSEVKVDAPYWKRIDNGDDKSGCFGTFALPIVKPDVVVPVIEVDLK